MKVSANIPDFSDKKCLISVGMFDGLHRGHRYFLEAFLHLADELKLEPILIGLNPHPRKVIHNIDVKCLNDVDEKILRLQEIGIKNYLLLDSSVELLNKTTVEFLSYLQAEGLNIKAVVMGFNNRFGKPVKGEASLDEQVKSLGLDFYRITPYGGEKLSSTLIREAIEFGRVEYANQMLGYHYQLKGKVIPGNQIGRKIGFPTANVRVNALDKLIPETGVYAVGLVFDETEFPAMMNIGYRPTIKEKVKDLFLEVHVLNQNLNLYDKEVGILFYKKVRDEEQFNSLDELKQQLLIDKDFIINYFNRTFVSSKNI